MNNPFIFAITILPYPGTIPFIYIYNRILQIKFKYFIKQTAYLQTILTDIIPD